MGLKSSIRPDGRREKVRIADVAGRFTLYKNLTYAVLILIYAVAPLANLGGHPLILIDILHRRFFLFGDTYNSQDFYLVFFLLSGGLFALFYISAVAGRLWCGWACPQTVFLEAVFRKIERLLEGPRSAQILLARAPWNFRKIGLLTAKHALFVLASLIISHIFLSYFVSVPELLSFMRHKPREHWDAFVWMSALTGLIYFNYAWFREQLCLVVCPYGKIQSALSDEDTVLIGYDSNRGEPRGKKSLDLRGDCIDCRRCVDVCPTGIDIRNGLQLECIGCANCIDACNAVMEKIGQETGLIRYASLNKLSGKPGRILRPRLYVYTAFLLLGMAVAGVFWKTRNSFEANLLRLSGSPYLLAEGMVRNQFTIHLINKTPQTTDFAIEVTPPPEALVTLALHTVTLESLADRMIPVFVSLPQHAYRKDLVIEVKVTDRVSQKTAVRRMPFLGP